MANLTVKEVVPPVKVFYEYTLNLSQEEYEALMVLVGSISGDFNHPLRRIVSKIWLEAFQEKFVKNAFGKKLEHYPKMIDGYSANVA